MPLGADTARTLLPRTRPVCDSSSTLHSLILNRSSWDSLSTKTDGKFKVAKVDCTTNRATCSDFQVRGYPTLKLLRDGKAYAYSGARTESAFLAYVNDGYASAESMLIPGSSAKEEVH